MLFFPVFMQKMNKIGGGGSLSTQQSTLLNLRMQIARNDFLKNVKKTFLRMFKAAF
jgi:hypothetical protein